MRVIPILVAALLSGCGTVADPDTDANLATTAIVQQPFELEVGESTLIEAARARITFVGVVADSRCPTNELIDCVWEGDGAVLIAVDPAAGGPFSVTLHTTLDPKTVVIGPVVLELTSLAPVPETTAPIPTDVYVATFVVQEALDRSNRLADSLSQRLRELEGQLRTDSLFP